MTRNGDLSVAVARDILRINGERLNELESALGLVEWIARGIRNLQLAGYDEPPPATIFNPEASVNDTWSGFASENRVA